MHHCTLVFISILLEVSSFRWGDLQLSNQHMAFFFNNNPEIAEECRISDSCPFKMHLDRPACWGYEEHCQNLEAYSQPSCPGDHKGWVASKAEQLTTFYNQGDFGFIKEQRDELKLYCEPKEQGDSSLECSDHLKFCRGKNIYIDFRDLKHRETPVRYHMDVLNDGQIGGHCSLNWKLLSENLDMISPLQSWGPELKNFQIKEEQITQNTICDKWVDTSTYIMKIDATVNMYHHFCDFFNLYAAQHVNATDEYAFSTDSQILIWETYPYQSNFGAMWDTFTKRPVWNLDKVAGKRVCFKQVVFPLLPRMIFGLYYNTPIIWGCENSGLFHAFSRHVQARLKIPERKDGGGKIHVTVLSRQTKHRRVLNEGKLIKAMERSKDLIIRKVDYSHQMEFKQQLHQDQWTDIFIGMHGAGLTHLLFLPDWAVIFELYNCGDPNCYKDLARLRGVKYVTWEDNTKLTPEDEGHHPEIGAHEKFTNYEFDVKEFMRLMRKCIQHVKSHRAWKNLQENYRKRQKKDEL